MDADPCDHGAPYTELQLVKKKYPTKQVCVASTTLYKNKQEDHMASLRSHFTLLSPVEMKKIIVN